NRMRISPHVFNDELDADRFVQALARRLRDYRPLRDRPALAHMLRCEITLASGRNPQRPARLTQWIEPLSHGSRPTVATSRRLSWPTGTIQWWTGLIRMVRRTRRDGPCPVLPSSAPLSRS